MSQIYEPSEDSYLMSDTLKKEIPSMSKENPNIKFLEIGVGSGINLETARALGIKKENILGSDLNPEAVEHCKKMGFNCVKSDLFNAFKGEAVLGEPWLSHKFDLIIFNPPYLPLDENEPKKSRKNTTAGKKGNELIIKFLEQAKNHLTKRGIILIITSSLSEKIDFSKLGYFAKEISSKKLFFEKLSVWECLKV